MKDSKGCTPDSVLSDGSMNQNSQHLEGPEHNHIYQFADGFTEAIDPTDAKARQTRYPQAKLLQDMSGYVRTNPGVSLGIVVAAGYLLSRLIRSR